MHGSIRLALAALLFAAGARAQVPAQRNLKVLPQDIPKAELMQMMRGFAFSLGVRCTHCHAAAAADGGAPAGQEKLDYASDAKPAKETARAMIKMVRAINQQYLAALPTPAKLEVSCTTCHRGLARPQAINDAMAEAIASKDAAAGVELYRGLRKQYYGSGAYDFTETPLDRLGEALMRKDHGREAAAVMELNAEVNAPLSNWGLNVLAMSHVAAGEKEKAKADYEKILAAQPEDDWARKQLRELEGKK